MFLTPLKNFRPLFAVSGRTLASSSPHVVKNTDAAVAVSAKDERELLLAKLKEDLPKPYVGPERDLVNFPNFPRPIYPGKVRMGFLPDEWFQFFYKKTGVTGPYVFGAGFITYLLSKELFVIEEEFSTGVSLFMLCFYALKKFGPKTRKWIDKEVDAYELRMNQDKENMMKEIEDTIALEKKNQWHAQGQTLLIAAKRENVMMQLETEYRKRMMSVYSEVKKRLDYQLDLHNTRQKLEQKHMVDWVVNNVVKSITPQQEKEALLKCIDDLNVLSAQKA